MTRGITIPDTVTIHVPFRIVKRGGRKEIQPPADAPVLRRTDNTLIKALARAFRWKRMLDSGEFATIAELAEREGIAPSYMTRVLRLTLLAPDIVEEALGCGNSPMLRISQLMEGFPLGWTGQRDFLGFPANSYVRTGVYSLEQSVYGVKPMHTGGGHDDC